MVSSGHGKRRDNVSTGMSDPSRGGEAPQSSAQCLVWLKGYPESRGVFSAWELLEKRVQESGWEWGEEGSRRRQLHTLCSAQGSLDVLE